MSKNKQYGMNIGSSSILLIFIILCLVSFAALSLSSAVADQNLTQKAADKTSAYYEACNIAEQKLSKIDTTLSSLYASTQSEEEYFSQTNRELSFSVSISDSQTLQVEIEVLYPTSSDGTFYEVTSWKEVTDESDLDYNETLPVFQ